MEKCLNFILNLITAIPCNFLLSSLVCLILGSNASDDLFREADSESFQHIHRSETSMLMVFGFLACKSKIIANTRFHSLFSKLPLSLSLLRFAVASATCIKIN